MDTDSRASTGLAFHSILFATPEDQTGGTPPMAPDHFADLNLDQVVNAVVAGRDVYDLRPFFFMPLRRIDAITYRHEIMRELEEDGGLGDAIRAFARQMRAMREHLTQADTLHYRYQKHSWFLDAVKIYCDAVAGLVRDLAARDLRSRGFVAFREHLASYVASAEFSSLVADTTTLLRALAAVRYSLLVKGQQIIVRRYEAEVDYSAEVEATFARFKRGAVKDYRVTFPTSPEMNHVEEAVLDLVARLYPDVFAALDSYGRRHGDYLAPAMATFDREIQFYMAYLEHVAALRSAGLPFCYPRVSETSKEVGSREGFDLALATRLVREQSPTVCNDFSLVGRERIVVVTGPNQGGKTTFARTFGQLHYLARLGGPVPGREARLFLCDRLFTHFEKEEHIENLRGKLEDDLVRIHGILEQATGDSVVVINEMFSSTTVDDAVLLGRRVLERLARLDALCVYVTFLDELASASEKTVSMVSTVAPDAPEVRTYKIVRRPADGLSYALAIARKYRLTYERLRERLTS